MSYVVILNTKDKTQVIIITYLNSFAYLSGTCYKYTGTFSVLSAVYVAVKYILES